MTEGNSIKTAPASGTLTPALPVAVDDDDDDDDGASDDPTAAAILWRAAAAIAVALQVASTPIALPDAASAVMPTK
jgi:hypothetical protein